MNYTYQHYQTGLTLLYNVGPRRAKELIRSLGSIEPLFHDSPIKLAQRTGYKTSFFRAINREQALLDAVSIVAFHEAKGINAIFYTDPRFSRRLNHCPDAPLLLFSKGDIDLNAHKFVAIVGTRAATPYGKEICRKLIESFQGLNIVVVSGLAHGIDSYVHSYCVGYKVPTAAILGHGLDRIYPQRNRSLAKDILSTGALITEFIPGTIPDRENFPKRNRIVAGICDATIVVESKTKGGSLITAALANSYDRDVFAFPGNINRETSQGCNALISQQKAHLIQSPFEFLTMMGWKDDEIKPAIQRSAFPDLNAIQKTIIAEIAKKQTAHIDLLSAHLKIPISKLNVELFNLEMAGVISELPGKRYTMT
ncbi:MAG: DNA-protecting protein DprA [Crocinitomicaceae bacterium]|nr:DNA-protecting protein DprA [Crocinitomicaceae bacterium]